MPVAIIEDPAILLPVHPGENAIELLHVGVVVFDPRRRFGHAEAGMAPAHAFDAGQADRFAVEKDLRAPDLDPPDAEGRLGPVQYPAVPGDRGFDGIEMGMVEVPELRQDVRATIGEPDLAGRPGGHGLLDGRAVSLEGRPRSSLLEQEMQPDTDRPRRRIADHGRYAQAGRARGQLGHGVDPEALDVDRRRYDEADRPGDAAVRRPVVGGRPRQHGRGEGVVDPDSDHVPRSEHEQSGDVEGEGRIAFAHVLSGLSAVDEDLGCVEDGLELDPDHEPFPGVGRGEFPPVPGAAHVVDGLPGDLPCGRDGDFFPAARIDDVGAVPAGGSAPAFWVRPEEPRSVERDDEIPAVPAGRLRGSGRFARPARVSQHRRARGRSGGPREELPPGPSLHGHSPFGESMEGWPPKINPPGYASLGAGFSSRPIFLRAMSPRLISGPSPGR